MILKSTTTALLAVTSVVVMAPASTMEPLVIDTRAPGPVISRDLFGQFAEHLGGGIYGGIWVGPDSPIPNVRGIRSDVVAALRAIKVPVVRWPGGCFADNYHWRDGIGPAAARRPRINADWGGVVEPNTFGTHEFMDFVGQIGSEAYIAVNLGSGTVQEAADWLEYMTVDPPTALGIERSQNGHPAPWKIKYVGFGNESWGCGGALTAQAYVDRMKLYSHFVLNHHPAQKSLTVPEWLARLDPAHPDLSQLEAAPGAMQRIAVGPDGEDPAYTEAVMKAWHDRAPFFWGLEGLSLHSYTFGGHFPMVSPASGFGAAEYAGMLAETLRMEPLIARHSAIMDRYDPQKKIALVVDEWGAWLKPEPGSNPVFLKQQNSMRDALLAALNLDIFARHGDRVRMANIAQMVNVLQSMILTEGERIILTPTYHVYAMYVPFHDATLLPVHVDAGTYRSGQSALPRVDAIAARSTDGSIWLAISNLDPGAAVDIPVQVDGRRPVALTGSVLAGKHVDSVNSLDDPRAVAPRAYAARASHGSLTVHAEPASLTVLKIELEARPAR